MSETATTPVGRQAAPHRNPNMRLLALTAAVLAVTASAAQAAPQVQAAWSRPAAQGSTGAGFMTLTNPDRKADALVAVETAGAREVQIHLTRMSGGMASMQAVTSVPVPAKGAVTFAPGGYHLMFMGLTRPLKVGDALPATLVFSSGAKVKASFVVRVSPPDAGPAGH